MTISVNSKKKQVKKTFDELLNDLRTSNSEKVRYNAARILGEMGDSKAVEPLIDVLKQIKNYYDKLNESINNIIKSLKVNVEHYKNFTYFPRIKNGVIVAGPEGEEYPVEISYRKLYVDDLSELCYRLSRSSADSETLTYERVDLLLQLVTRDFTNPSTNIQAELDAYLLDKKVFCVNQKYTTGYTQIIPYNVVVYHTEPYSLNLNKSLSEEITKALTKYYDEDGCYCEVEKDICNQNIECEYCIKQYFERKVENGN